MIRYFIEFGTRQSRANADIMENYINSRGYDANMGLNNGGKRAVLIVNRKLDTSTEYAVRGNMTTEEISFRSLTCVFV